MPMWIFPINGRNFFVILIVLYLIYRRGGLFKSIKYPLSKLNSQDSDMSCIKHRELETEIKILITVRLTIS